MNVGLGAIRDREALLDFGDRTQLTDASVARRRHSGCR